jgi:hypothetical protein
MVTLNPDFVKVYNSLTSTGSDIIANAGGVVSIKDGTANAIVLKDFLTSNAIAGSKRTMALAESAKTATFAVSAASAGLSTRFNIVQNIAGVLDSGEAGGDGRVEHYIEYVAVAGETTTDIAEGIVAQINALSDAGQLKVTASNSTNTITLAGQAGAPLWTVSGTANLGAETSTMYTEATVTVGTPSANGVTVMTVASGATGRFAAGDTVNLANFNAGDGDYVVQGVTNTTLSLFDEGATITASSGGRNVTLLAQESRFIGADLTSAGVAENLAYAVEPSEAQEISATALYTKVEFHFYDAKGFGGFNQASGDQRYVLEMYIDQSIASASYDAAETAIDAVLAAIPS